MQSMQSYLGFLRDVVYVNVALCGCRNIECNTFGNLPFSEITRSGIRLTTWHSRHVQCIFIFDITFNKLETEDHDYLSRPGGLGSSDQRRPPTNPFSSLHISAQGLQRGTWWIPGPRKFSLGTRLI